jgi:hypothetical protein
MQQPILAVKSPAAHVERRTIEEAKIRQKSSWFGCATLANSLI